MILQEFDYHTRCGITLDDLISSAVNNAQTYGSSIQNHPDLAQVITFADRLIIHSVDFHCRIAFTIPCQNLHCVFGGISHIGRFEVQFIFRSFVTGLLVYQLTVEPNLDLVGVNGITLRIGSGTDPKQEILGIHRVRKAIQIGNDRGRILSLFRVILVRLLRFIANLITDIGKVLTVFL